MSGDGESTASNGTGGSDDMEVATWSDVFAWKMAVVIGCGLMVVQVKIYVLYCHH